MAENNLKPQATNVRNLAIIIDADSTECPQIPAIIAEAEKFGRVTVKRIYADWTSPSMNGWKDQINKYSMKPIQKFDYKKAKKTADTAALIIDVMDLLHSKTVNGFCIVSSDSDYTGLALRIKEQGYFIMGIGKSNTPSVFVKACEIFSRSDTKDVTTSSQDGGNSLKRKYTPSAKKMVGIRKGNSAYIFFCIDKRKEVKEANATASFGEIGQLLGKAWNDLPDEQKEVI
jgi:hypothetical protein